MTDDDDWPDEIPVTGMLFQQQWMFRKTPEGLISFLVFDSNSRQYLILKNYDNELDAEADSIALNAGYSVADIIDYAVTARAN